MFSLKRQAHLPYKQSFSTICFEINVISLTELTSQNITAITTLYLRICLGLKSNVDRRNLSVISWLAPTWLPLLLFRVPARLSLRVGRLLEELSVWWKTKVDVRWRSPGITTSQEQLASLATIQEVTDAVSIVSRSRQLLFYPSFRRLHMSTAHSRSIQCIYILIVTCKMWLLKKTRH